MKSILFFLLLLILSLLFYLAYSERFAYLNGTIYQQFGFHFQAAEMFDKACDNGNPRACIDLGKMFEMGDGVEKDTEKARSYYQKGYEHGFTPAQEHLKNMD